MHKREQRRNGGPQISPFGSWEYQRLATAIFGLFGLLGFIKSGMRPGPDDPKAWYDRTIRAVGGILILLLIVGGAAAVIVASCSPR